VFNLILQFVTTFISGVVSAEKAAKNYVKGVAAQDSQLQDFFNTNQSNEQEAESKILSEYEMQLKKQKTINEIKAGVFAVFLIIVALIAVYYLSKNSSKS